MPYNLSTDYPALYALLLAGEEVACFVDEESRRCIIQLSNQWILFGDYLRPYKPSSLEQFISDCTRLNLQYIPQIDIKQVAGAAWSAGGLNGFTSDRKGDSDEPTKEQYLNTL